MQCELSFSGRELWGSVCKCLAKKVDSLCMPIWRKFRIWKKCHTPEILRNLALFWNPQYSTFKHFKIACKLNQLPWPGAVRICEMLVGKCLFTLHVSLEHFEVEFWRSEKNAKILTSSGIWHIFQIFWIKFVRAANGHAKCRHFSCQGAV